MSPYSPCPRPGAGPDRAPGNAGRGLTGSAARCFTLPVSTGGLSYSAHGRIYDAAWKSPYWYHFPALNVNAAGDLLVGFSGSRATEYIGAFFLSGSQGRRHGDDTPRPGSGRLGTIHQRDPLGRLLRHNGGSHQRSQ